MVQDLVRKEVVKRILAGQSLMVPSPPVEDSTPPTPAAVSEGLRAFRATLFDHVAKPSPLPQNLCTEDVRDFKSISLWEEHLRQMQPWQDNQYSEKVSLINGLQTDQVIKRRSDPTGLAKSKQPFQAFTSPRASPTPGIEPQVSHPPSFKVTNDMLLEQSASTSSRSHPFKGKSGKTRGRTFVTLPVAKKQVRLKG